MEHAVVALRERGVEALVGIFGHTCSCVPLRRVRLDWRLGFSFFFLSFLFFGKNVRIFCRPGTFAITAYVFRRSFALRCFAESICGKAER